MKSLKGLVLALALSACAAPVVAHVPVPEVKKEVVTPKVDPALVDGGAWTMHLELPHLWKKQVKAGTDYYAMAELPSGALVSLQVESAPAVQESFEFVKQTALAEANKPGVQIINGTKAFLSSGELVVGLVELRMYSTGGKVALLLITHKGNRGYIASCSGLAENANEFESLCAETLQSFAFRAVEQVKK